MADLLNSQSANIGPNQIISSFNTLKHQQEICYRQFPTGLASGYLPSAPQVHRTNHKFNGWRNSGRSPRVMYTGGQFDPWRTLSFLSTESFAPPNLKLTQAIPDCDAKPADD